jgi:UDP-N-acetylmuramoyl-tripeptide--D-alanyl-D-alanine ligase
MLEAGAQDQIAVWELGMNHPGEIATLARLAAPDVGIITNVGIAHIEFMITREAIADEKGALAEALAPEGTLILNADDNFSASIARRTQAQVVFAGVKTGSLRATDLRQSASGSEFTILEGAHRCRAQLPVPGLHMVQDAILAVAAGRLFGLSLEECAGGLASAPLTKARLQIKSVGGVDFIDDSYNANPESMCAALRTLVELEADGRHIAVLGAMAELGAESERGHRDVGQAAAELGVDWLIAIGPTAAAMAEAASRAGLEKSSIVASPNEAADLLAAKSAPGDLVLIKGSRAARTELVLEKFGQHQHAEGIAS